MIDLYIAEIIKAHWVGEHETAKQVLDVALVREVGGSNNTEFEDDYGPVDLE